MATGPSFPPFAVTISSAVPPIIVAPELVGYFQAFVDIYEESGASSALLNNMFSADFDLMLRQAKAVRSHIDDRFLLPELPGDLKSISGLLREAEQLGNKIFVELSCEKLAEVIRPTQPGQLTPQVADLADDELELFLDTLANDCGDIKILVKFLGAMIDLGKSVQLSEDLERKMARKVPALFLAKYGVAAPLYRINWSEDLLPRIGAGVYPGNKERLVQILLEELDRAQPRPQMLEFLSKAHGEEPRNTLRDDLKAVIEAESGFLSWTNFRYQQAIYRAVFEKKYALLEWWLTNLDQWALSDGLPTDVALAMAAMRAGDVRALKIFLPRFARSADRGFVDEASVIFKEALLGGDMEMVRVADEALKLNLKQITAWNRFADGFSFFYDDPRISDNPEVVAWLEQRYGTTLSELHWKSVTYDKERTQK